jgi:hypothetical protein
MPVRGYPTLPPAIFDAAARLGRRRKEPAPGKKKQREFAYARANLSPNVVEFSLPRG